MSKVVPRVYGPLGVDVRAGMQTLHVMLDPAADFSVTPKAAKAAGITGDRVPELDLGFVGNVGLRNVPAKVQNGGVPDYDGSIGTPIFTAYRTIVDIANRAMSLYRFDKRPLDGTILPIDLVNGKYPAVRAAIGGVPVRLAIVLEAAGEVTLKRSFAVKHALLPAHAPLAPRYSKTDAVFDAGEKLLTLGPLSQTARTFVMGNFPNPDIDGYIGLDVMRAYVMEFDYSRRELGLKPIRY